MLILTARFQARQNKQQQVKGELMALVEPSRTDPACITFELHEAADDEAQFLLYEVWSSREAFELHIKQPFMQSYSERIDKLLAEPRDVTFWQKSVGT